MKRFAAAVAFLLACGDGAPAASELEAAFPCAELSARFCDAAGPTTATCHELASALELLSDSTCRAGLADIEQSLARLAERAGRCAELVTRLCVSVGTDTASCQRVRADAALLPSDRCAMMLAHYDATLAAIQAEAASEPSLGAEQQRALAAGSPPGFGPPDARVTLVAFVDFECPFCARAAPVLARVRERYAGRVRLVVRQYPLDGHANARAAAEAALAAHAQGRFWELHDRLYAHQHELDRATLSRLAGEAGIDVVTFDAALTARRFAAAVDADRALGERVAVDGTPTLFVNGARVRSAADFDEVARLIDAALGG